MNREVHVDVLHAEIAGLAMLLTSYGSATLGVDYALSANVVQLVVGSSIAAVTLTIVDAEMNWYFGRLGGEVMGCR
jgi:hypothetical protein